MSQTIVKLLKEMSEQYPDTAVQMYKDDSGNFLSVTYRQFFREVQYISAALKSLNVNRGDNIGLISDNRKEWLASDAAILALGAVDVPRGRDATLQELQFILNTSECRICFVENEDQSRKVLSLKDNLPLLETVIIMDELHHLNPSGKTLEGSVEIMNLTTLIQKGKVLLEKEPDMILKKIDEGRSEDLATIIFTSGTTGEPKGVMLTHENFLFQLEQLPKVIDFKKGERWLSVLPVWHSFERILQYVVISQASTVVYSKPIGKIMLVDIQRTKPQWMGSV
ncbi:MAG: AMP-binding protein, partial [Sphaerochaetaceae bacterium]